MNARQLTFTAALLIVLGVARIASAEDPPVAVESSTTPPKIIQPDDGDVSITYGPYQYDPSGNIVAIGTSTFNYDPMGRLVGSSVTSPAYPAAGAQTGVYAYDAFGNRTSVSGQSYPAAPSNNQLTGNGALYDAAGNLIQWQPPGSSATREYTYDSLDMLTRESTTDANGAPLDVTYVYTADDERLWSFYSTNVSEWSLRDFDGKVVRQYLQEWAGTEEHWTVAHDYIFRDGVPLADISPSGTRHYSVDHLGSPRLITDSSGYRFSSHDYLPFGAEWQQPGAPDDGGTLQFTGHERDDDLRDEENGTLDYMHARFYSGNAGRFLSVDPAKASKPRIPQSWNRYSYTVNNPLKYIDRNGQFYELASVADRQFYVDAITRGTWNKAARELVQRQAGDPWHKIVLRTGTLPGVFVFGDSSRIHAPYQTVSGNLFPSGITMTVDQGKLAMTNYPTPTISAFHELGHVDMILYHGLAANAQQPDKTTLNTMTGQVTTNSIFESFGLAAATTPDDPMHALSAETVSNLIADPGEGKAAEVMPCESIMCINRSN